MFGSIGGPEVILLFIMALLLFGPRRLPEIGRTLGKALAEFRRATNDFKVNLEREVQLEEIKSTIRPLETAASPHAIARGIVEDALAPAPTPAPEPGPAAEAEKTLAPPDDTTNGGTGSIH